MGGFEDLKAMIVAGDERAVAETRALLAEGRAARDIIDNALLPGMNEVGRLMRAGERFIPEVLLSARTMQACLGVVKPLLTAGESANVATVVIGTVEGDLHDIGKNLVAMLLEGAGFTVIDLGKSITTDAFIVAVEQHDATVLGMSALLTTTLPKMREAIEALEQSGRRKRVRVIVGGAPVSQAYADEIGADAYGSNAADAVDRCRELVQDSQSAGA
jgi:5-methyltetrahydrofolate--homocysteine methyltransferase